LLPQKILRYQMDRDIAAMGMAPLGGFPPIVAKLLAEFG
jgi:hypothetical protein